MKKKYIAGIVILILLILSYVVLLAESPATAAKISREDGIIENLSAVFFFMAACVLIFLFVISRSKERIYFLNARRNYFILLLGIFFFFCAGEEISWGQRIFGFKTPESMVKMNAQGETNFHNLYLFQGTDRNKNLKSGIEFWLTAHKLFALFWILFCVLLPALSLLSDGTSNILKGIYFPVIPFWLGLLFLLNHVISKVFEKLDLFPKLTPIIETKETDFAFLFLMVSVLLYLRFKGSKLLA